MLQIEFNIELRPYSPSMKAQVMAVSQPLLGAMQSFRKEHVLQQKALNKEWCNRAIRLKHEGWRVLQSEKIVYVCNCPPFACGYEPKTQPCKLRICPFCHARKVSDIYTRIQDLIQQIPGSVKVVAWRRMFGFDTDEDRIFYDDDMGMRTFTDNVNPRHRTIRTRFQKERVKDALGGIYWYTAAPFTYQRASTDGSVGRWNVLHSCVAVMQADWEPWESKYLKVLADPDDYQLAYLVGRSFQFRPLWLRAKADVMASFLNATHREVFLSAFGKLGSHYGRKKQTKILPIED